jgi:hypothetical protein
VDEPNNTELVEQHELGSHNSGENDTLEVAQLETTADITLAAIDAETERARIDANREVALAEIEATKLFNEELEECRNQISALKSQLTALENSLTPPPVPEPQVETEQLEIVPETNSMDQSTVTPEASIETALSDVNEDVEQIVERPIKRFVGI